MKHFRKNDGFTLVELMVSILVGTLITGAAVTVLLLGLRIHKSSTDTASRQNTTRIVLTVLENLAEEGKITDVRTSLNSWEVIEKKAGIENVLLSYDALKQAIYTGKAPTAVDEEGSPILKDVYASHISLEERLLVFSVQTEDGSYTSSVYCRTVELTEIEDEEDKKEEEDAVTPEDNIDDSETKKVARVAFLNKLLSQKDRTVISTVTYNPGLILTEAKDSNGDVIPNAYVSTGKYYTDWYIGGYENNPGWNKDTPWCAAYVSWCLEQMRLTNHIGDAPKFANVDLFWEAAKNNTNGIKEYFKREAKTPQPGDLVFFDWIINAEENPQHMGVVLSVSGDTIFTIEGNTAGRVALRKYAVSDERILGYGVLNWK